MGDTLRRIDGASVIDWLGLTLGETLERSDDIPLWKVVGAVLGR